MTKRSDLMQKFISSCFRTTADFPPPAPDDQDSWTILSNALEDTSLLAFAYHTVQNQTSSWIPPENIFLHWKRMAHRVALQNAYYEKHAASLFKKLNEAGIKYLMLKGFALADVCYGSRSIREIGDIDIFVNAKDLDETISVLLSEGFQFCPLPGFADLGEQALAASKKHLHELAFRKMAGPIAIDIDLQQEGNRYLQGTIIDKMFPESSVDWFSDARTIDMQGIQVNCMSLEKEFLFCVFHYVLHHLLSGPKWCVDICQFIRTCGDELDWAGMKAMIPDRNLSRLVILALHVCCDLMGETKVLQKATDAGFNEFKPSPYAVHKYQANIFEHTSLVLRYRTFLTLPATFTDRLKLIRYLLFDKTASMEGRNPDIKRNKCSNLIFVIKRIGILK